MSKDQRLEIEQSTFKQDSLICLTCSPKEVSKHVAMLRVKYNVSQETVYYRIRTLYGNTLANLRKAYRIPSKDVLLQIVKMSTSAKEVQEKLGLTDWEIIGLYDKVLGVSTFHAAQNIVLKSLVVTEYNPSIRDNRAMIYASRLGDGSWDTIRKSLRLEHCSKQQKWLEQKVHLLNRAFPYLPVDNIKYTNRDTYTWYSRKTYGDFIRYNEQPKLDMVKQLNEFGIWWLFLDDGHYSKNVLGFAVENIDIANALSMKLSEYSFQFKIVNKNWITIQDQKSFISFSKTFLEPFRHLTPQCMYYKVDLKV